MASLQDVQKSRRQPRLTVCAPHHRKALPDKPGVYFWDAWGEYVTVYKKPRFGGLFVKPPVPNAVEVRITPRIAGDFYYYAEAQPS